MWDLYAKNSGCLFLARVPDDEEVSLQAKAFHNCTFVGENFGCTCVPEVASLINNEEILIQRNERAAWRPHVVATFLSAPTHRRF